MTDEIIKDGEVIVPVGDITILVNIPPRSESELTDEVLASVQSQVIEKFLSRAEVYGVDLTIVRIVNVSSALGCITVTITIGIAVPILWLGGKLVSKAAQFVKDSPAYRKGLLLMASDVKKAYVKVNGDTYEKSATVYRETLRPARDKQLIQNEAEAAIKEIEQRRKL